MFTAGEDVKLDFPATNISQIKLLWKKPPRLVNFREQPCLPRMINKVFFSIDSVNHFSQISENKAKVLPRVFLLHLKIPTLPFQTGSYIKRKKKSIKDDADWNLNWNGK